MTMTPLMLSMAMTLYIFIGLYFEEKDLVATLGQDYKNYQETSPNDRADTKTTNYFGIAEWRDHNNGITIKDEPEQRSRA